MNIELEQAIQRTAVKRILIKLIEKAMESREQSIIDFALDFTKENQ